MDHPRLRGEKSMILQSSFLNMGSPPLARGKGSLIDYISIMTGITPACAGKRPKFSSVTSLMPDHPRLRGEKLGSGSCSRLQRGSPPLARGKEVNISSAKVIEGITPACAGKRCLPSSTTKPARDHPRLRGEKSGRFPARAFWRGSPPLARGKECRLRRRPRRHRITPACAGKRLKGSLNISFLRRSRSVFI